MDRLMRKEFAELLEISEPMKIVDNLSIGMISKKKKKIQYTLLITHVNSWNLHYERQIYAFLML
jgi:hypothetical protein